MYRRHSDDDETWDDRPRDPDRIRSEQGDHGDPVDRLLRELISTSSDQRVSVLGDPRFRDPKLLERLLQLSQEEQFRHPVQAEELALLAARLSGFLGEEMQKSPAALPRALCLGANARRLANDVLAADALLAHACPFLETLAEKAFYSRVAALIRWQEGRLEESQALLQHAARLYLARGSRGEAGACKSFLGMLLYEEGGLGDPLSALQSGWIEMPHDATPLLALRTGLTLANCLADRLQVERAQWLLKEVWPLYSQLSDDQELLHAFWLEGRVLAKFGRRDEALSMLESVRLRFLTGATPAEAALVSMDLVPLLAAEGRPEHIQQLATDLLTALGPMDLAEKLISSLAEVAKTPMVDLPYSALNASRSLRRAFRAEGCLLQPLPFL
jgi:tetratricopeptide (TPR) repeat protein